MPERYKLKHVDNIAGETKAIFIIDNLTSEEYIEELNYKEIQERISDHSADSPLRIVYTEALNAIDQYNNSLTKVHELYDTGLLVFN